MEELLFTHDRFFKQAMSHPKVAKEFFKRHLPSKIRDKVDLSTLKLQNNSYLDDHLKASMTDMLFSAEFSGKQGFFYLLVEHQSQNDPLMAFRLLKYMISIMSQHLKATREKILPLVYPVVFYNGRSHYCGSTDLFDLFSESDLAREILFQPFQLVDVSQLDDIELRTDIWAGVMEFVMKHIWARDFLPYLDDLIPMLRELEAVGQVDYIQAIFCYTIARAESKGKRKVIETFRTSLSPQMGEKAMTIAEELIAEGVEKGFLKGIAEGKTEGKTEGLGMVALNLLRTGNSIEYVSEVTGLSIEALQSLVERSQDISVH